MWWSRDEWMIWSKWKNRCRACPGIQESWNSFFWGFFSTVWESSLSFCLWVSLEMKPHFGSTAVEWQFVVARLESLQFVLWGFPWSGSGGRSELPFCSVNREEVNLRSSSSVMVTGCFYLCRVSSGWYFVPHEVLLLELLPLAVFLKQQFLPPLLFWIVLVLSSFLFPHPFSWSMRSQTFAEALWVDQNQQICFLLIFWTLCRHTFGYSEILCWTWVCSAPLQQLRNLIKSLQEVMERV